jgi:hypothetical protein
MTKGGDRTIASAAARTRTPFADVPMIVLFNGSELSALRNNVKGYAGWLYPEPRFWGVSLQ